MFDFKNLTRDEIERHSVDMRQFIQFQRTTLPSGMRVVEAHNSSGLTFTVMLDRGLDIWQAHYKGIPLTWISQGSPHLPDFGQNFLQQFNGGLLTTCGLTHVGPPEHDDQTGEFRDLHGRYSRQRAENVQILPVWMKDKNNDKEYYTLELSGLVAESTLFKEQLRLERTYFMTMGRPEIDIFDKVTNVGDTPAPLMLLYHFNLGFPLVSKGAKLYTPNQAVYPRTDVARSGLSTWADYDEATPCYEEQVFFHHVKTARNSTHSEVALLHEDFGLSLSWDTPMMPYFTQWKNTRQGVYVSGIEPGNCIPEGQMAARQQGRLVYIEPGRDHAHRFHSRLTILDGVEAVTDCQRRIDSMQQNGVPVANVNLTGYTP
ncbi:MAG TPA: aldose 1-epimerase family protein [Phototrophicaceae bacterium]|nr:aldose 1-epimerase family protein [Phototrophicaceae bacterium]